VRFLIAAVLCAVCLSAATPDADIERDIRARFAKSKISSNGFEVRVRNGTATLTGRTEVIQHKGVATRLAKSGGASKVDNRIEISAAARSKASTQLSRVRQTHRAEAPPSKPEPKEELAPPPVRRAVVKH
jgi:osmotically-inducible protein OsmY